VGGWIGDGGVSHSRNPSSIQKTTFLEGMQGSRDGVKTGDTSLIFGRESRELEAGIKEIANEVVYGKNKMPNVESGDINEDEESSGPKKENKTKYVGFWDSSLGRMRYENVDENFCDILLEKDPKDNSYHPRVVPRTQEKEHAVFLFKAAIPSHTEKSTEIVTGFPKGQVSLADKESTPNPPTAKEKIRKSPASVANWKKRARQGQNSVAVTTKKKGTEGKRKLVEDEVYELDGADSLPKKGRKAEGVQAGPIKPNPMIF
jgi:hypothetical protein